ADAPGIAVTDGEILAGIFLRLRKMYAEQGGANPEQVLSMTWNYSTPHEPASEEVAMESNGKALADITDPATGAVIVKKGQQLSSFAQLRDDGTTSSGCWIFAGSWTPEGNQMARRDNADPSGLGNTLGWAWAWPLNRRILYNRASADPQGNPWDPKRQILKWDGAKWSGMDIPDYSAAAPGSNVGPFIMQPEGMGRLFAIDKMAEGPFPEHYEPFETPLGTNPLHPNVISNPAARIFKGDAEALGKADKFPYVGTTYRLTEHFHYWTKHALLNAIAQPEQFVEIGEKLANKLGISHGDTVKVSSNRGYIKAKAVVTKRIRTLKANGQDIDTIGIPIHWGYEGVAKKGFIANTLTPFVGDANTQTPEFKSFLVNVEKV
ncbi:molybdopterin dinucleotide binding domain-containing protein, partial [Citrobacter sp. wls758]